MLYEILSGIIGIIIIIIIGLFYHNYSFVTSKPNEWLLILRNGIVIISGVGASGYRRPGDQVVKFPSKINRVNFSAQQISVEKQGLELHGVLIWTIFREDDGPLRAYRFLGNDIASDTPNAANETLREMCNSIVRHRISNSTIEDILTKRDEIRNEIRREIQKLVSGWGIWLESAEITEVRVLSSTLFSNLQVSFRESSRKSAELIQMKTESELQQVKAVQALEAEKLRIENQTKQQINSANEALKLQIEKQKLFEKEKELERAKIDANAQVQRHQQICDYELEIHQQQLNLQKRIAQMEREKEISLKQREIQKLANEISLENELANLEILARKDGYTRESNRLNGEMQNELLRKLDYKLVALNTAKEIYSKLPIKEVKMVNMSSGNQDTDPAMQLVGKLFTSVQALQQNDKE